MPTNWDELLNQYDTTFNPKYPKTDPFSYPTQQGMNQPQGGMGFGGVIPEYDFTPMQRYKDYLGSEPTREQYKPGKFGTILNSLSAGFESMNNGIGRGAALYDVLEGRDYNKAYQGWQNRANKYKTDVELENTRYKTATTDYDRAQDNLRQSRSVDATVRNANTNEQRLALEEKKYQDQGYQLKDSGNGTQIGVRIRGGQAEQVPTNIPNANLTPQQRIDQFNTRENNAMKRWQEPSGSAKLGAQTSIRNVERGIQSRESEGALGRASSEGMNRERIASQEWRDVTGPETRSKTVSDVPSQTNTAPKLLAVFPEFDDPKLVGVQGEQFTPVGLETSDPEEFKRIMREKSSRLGIPPVELLRRWETFKQRATPLVKVTRGQ